MVDRNVTPVKRAMAPAVWRMMAPRPSPSNAKSARNTPESTTARSTPGWFSAAVGAPPERTACPRKKEVKLSTSPITSAPRPTTSTLAAMNTPRRGMAASEERIVPDPYSPVMASTPSTPMASEPTSRPLRDWAVGSNP